MATPPRAMFLVLLWAIVLAALAYPLSVWTRDQGFGGVIVFLLVAAAVPLLTGVLFRRAPFAPTLGACIVFALAYAYCLALGYARFMAAHGGPPVRQALADSLYSVESLYSAGIPLVLTSMSLIPRLLMRADSRT